jgi:hypothetical protein
MAGEPIASPRLHPIAVFTLSSLLQRERSFQKVLQAHNL